MKTLYKTLIAWCAVFVISIVSMSSGCSKSHVIERKTATAPRITPTAVPEASHATIQNIQKKFISQNYPDSPDYETLQQRIKRVEYWCRVAGVNDPSWPVALFYEESKFGEENKGITGETDFGQIHPKWRKHYEGVRLKIFGDVFNKDSLDYEIALAVAAYWENLRVSKGDHYDAVRRYHHGKKGGEVFAMFVDETRSFLYPGK